MLSLILSASVSDGFKDMNSPIMSSLSEIWFRMASLTHILPFVTLKAHMLPSGNILSFSAQPLKRYYPKEMIIDQPT